MHTRQKETNMKHIATLMASLALIGFGFPPGVLAAGHQNTGVVGQVFIDACAVVHLGDVCLFPYKTSITVLADDGRVVADVNTDDHGRFKVRLKPGAYMLVPFIPNAGQFFYPYPYAAPLEVAVTKKDIRHVRPVTIIYDSGIR